MSICRAQDFKHHGLFRVPHQVELSKNAAEDVQARQPRHASINALSAADAGMQIVHNPSPCMRRHHTLDLIATVAAHPVLSAVLSLHHRYRLFLPRLGVASPVRPLPLECRVTRTPAMQSDADEMPS